MEESKKVYVHYEGSPEYTHVARITGGLTAEQLAVEFSRVYNAKHGRMVRLDPAMMHLLNGRRRMSRSANLLRLVNDGSDIFVEQEMPAGRMNSLDPDDGAIRTPVNPRDGEIRSRAHPTAPKDGAICTPANPRDGELHSPGSPRAPTDGETRSPAKSRALKDGEVRSPANPRAPKDGAVSSPANPSDGEIRSPANPRAPKDGANSTPANPSDGEIRSPAKRRAPKDGAVSSPANPSDGESRSPANPSDGEIRSAAKPRAPSQKEEKQRSVSPLESVPAREEDQSSALEADLAAAARRVPALGGELREPFICAVLVSAIKAQQMRKYNFAGSIFSSVLAVLPKQQICLRGLGSIALELRNYAQALAWLQRGAEEYPNDALFHARLGDAYAGLEQYKEALGEYDLALGLAMEQRNQRAPVEKQTSILGASTLPAVLGVSQELLDKIDYDPRVVDGPAAGDIAGAVTVEGLNVALAALFCRRGSEADLQLAEHILLKAVLAQNPGDEDALYQYGALLLARGEVQPALKIFLKLLVARPTDEKVRSGVAKAVKRPEGMSLLKKEVAEAPAGAPVLAFLASCVKDFGAIGEAIHLYNLAIGLNPMSVGYFLSQIHLHEVMHEYWRALGLAMALFESLPSFTLHELQFGDLLPYFHGAKVTETVDTISQQPGFKFRSQAEFFRRIDRLPNRVGSDSDSRSRSSRERKEPEGKCSYSDQQLDGLAVLFTVTKILFVGGALDMAKQLARLIEPARSASMTALHQTVIRNEAAYFTSVQQILEEYPIPMPLPALAEQVPLFLAGDSHCLSAAWRTVRLRGQSRLLVPMLVTGLKVWHLRPESQFYPKHAFQNLMESVANGAQLVMVYGEIDCRESILSSVERGVYRNVEHGVEVVVNIYIEVLLQLILSRGFELFVHPVPPVLNETRAIVLAFNRVLQRRIALLKEESAAGGRRLRWLDFGDDLLTGEGFLREQYKLDGTHLSPNYSSLIQRELSKVK